MTNFNQYRDIDFLGEMISAIENDYGAPIERIAKCEEHGGFFTFSLIFNDYRLLEAKVQVQTLFNTPSIQIHGVYY